MKQKLFLFGMLIFFARISALPGQSSPTLFDDNSVSAIYLTMPPDSFDYLIKYTVNTRYMQANLAFVSGSTTRDTLQNIGLRLRGNTSLGAQKKSFKVSFNEFQSGRKYQGVKKLNLRGSANDPTMVREKLFYEVWEKAGMPKRRAAFAKLYINGQYRGLYTNIEEIDKEWLEDAYGNNAGNLYKCTWPADLAYLGDDPQLYKKILNNPTTRAYDLTTNETADDYSRLIFLIKVLNGPTDAAYAAKIKTILNVPAVLKAFALDVATGNWDDYFYNKNNYYLYDNPGTGLFEYVTFDTDNTFGIDWVNRDWAKRAALTWYRTGEARPLATKLLEVPAFKDQFIRYLDTISRRITYPDSIFPRINALRSLITPAASGDQFRTLDFGYTMGDFYNGFEKTLSTTHTPYGIKPFLITRYSNTISQITGLLSATNSPAAAAAVPLIQAAPNPSADWVIFQSSSAINGSVQVVLYDLTGRTVAQWQWDTAETTMQFSVKNLVPGQYVAQWRSADQAGNFRMVRR